MEPRNEFEDAIDRRHKIVEKVKKLMEGLGSAKSKEIERQVIALLKENSRLRKKLNSLADAFERKEMEREELEYYRTMLDYIVLVDCEREEEVIEQLIRYAEEKEGPLRDNIEWLVKELEESRRLKIKSSC